MILYILTSPRDSHMVLTADAAVIEKIQAEAAVDGFQFDVLTWDNEVRPLMLIQLDFQPSEPPKYVNVPVPPGGYHA
jgi:hypothetical protein